jgi:hypothetical protein
LNRIYGAEVSFTTGWYPYLRQDTDNYFNALPYRRKQHATTTPCKRATSTMESTMQQRKDEILAKKAKLAELKRQRELRRETMAGRASMGGSPDASLLEA